MKTLLLSLCLFTGLNTFTLNAQVEKSHFDNKPYVEGEMLVQINEKTSLKALVSQLPAPYGVEIAEEVSAPMRIWLLKFNHQAISHEAMQKLLYRQAGIAIVDYNYHIEFRATVPNDAQFSQQWHHVNTGQTGGTADADIDSDLAWDITTGGTTATGDNIVVCVVESANLTHTDLAGNAWFNTGEIAGNGIDDDGNGYIDDYRGWNPAGSNDVIGTGAHGTNCAGMIGAKGNNTTGVAGANWNVKIMSVTVGSLNQANVIASYTYPLVQRKRWNASNGTQGAFVVATSSSWGIDNANAASYPLWCQFYDTLGKYGIISIGATTNNNSNVDNNGDMPTNCGSRFLVGVGRTDHNDNTAGGFGVINVDFGAPGINVRTTANTNTYTTTTGTSFSCPLTAGVVGLAYAIPCSGFMDIVKSDAEAGADLVLDAMMQGVDVKSQLASKFRTGGRLNAKNTLDLLMTASCSGTFCAAPGNISTQVISDDEASASWTPFADAESTTLFYKKTADATWTEVVPTGNTYSFPGLEPCTAYQYYLVTTCADEAESNPSATYTFTTTGCGNCIELPYCTATATNSGDEWIQSFKLGTFTQVSGNNSGYGNHTGIGGIQLQPGTSYPVTVTPGFAGQTYTEYSRVWIDLNQNGTFETSELLYNQGTATAAPANGTITIPANAMAGSTRLRVILAYQGSGQTTLPAVCGSYTYGEVEDYCVEIIPQEICNFVVSNTVVQPTCTGMDNGSIAVNVSGGTPGYTFEWSNNETTNEISDLAAGNYTVTIEDAAGCDSSFTVSLSYQTTLNISVTKTNPACNNAEDGSATAAATGGTGISYAWTDGPATATYSGIGSGTYTVVATDAQGCTVQGSAVLTNPPAHQASYNKVVNNLTVTFTNTSTAGTVSWDFGDGNTSAVNNPVHTYSDYGTYNVCLNVETACGTFTDCESIQLVDVTGLDEQVAMTTKLYPNPVSSELIVEIHSPLVKSIHILDVSGKHLGEIAVNGELNTVDSGNLSDGLYFCNLMDASGKAIHTARFVVKH